ncbi:unnamed protein product, partial [marine sediment metagenome]
TGMGLENNIDVFNSFVCGHLLTSFLRQKKTPPLPVVLSGLMTGDLVDNNQLVRPEG